MATLSARFIRAVRALENELDLQSLAQLYVDDCEVSSSLTDEHYAGVDGVRRYWRTYLDAFQVIRTEFTSTVDGQRGSALEWISSATMPDGRPLELSGMTMLLSKDAHITSMHVYFDPRPLLATPARKEPTPIRVPFGTAKTA